MIAFENRARTVRAYTTATTCKIVGRIEVAWSVSTPWLKVGKVVVARGNKGVAGASAIIASAMTVAVTLTSVRGIESVNDTVV